jgi:hypothetical protein
MCEPGKQRHTPSSGAAQPADAPQPAAIAQLLADLGPRLVRRGSLYNLDLTALRRGLATL